MTNISAIGPRRVKESAATYMSHVLRQLSSKSQPSER